MAKKQLVKYAFGTPEAYQSLKDTNQLQEFTVYFITSPGSEYGTLYRGKECIGSGIAEKIVFSKDLVISTGTGPDAEVVHTIKAGTSLADYAKNSYLGLLYASNAVEQNIVSILESDYVSNTDMNTIRYEIGQETDTKLQGYYTKADADSSFLSKSEIGRIGELAEILDASTVDLILAAAEGIEAVVKDYYKKPEVDQFIADVNNVLTFDSSAQFPPVGDRKVLYIDDEENTMYRWALEVDGSTARDYTEITGAGGGGSANVKVESNIYVKGAKTAVSIAKGNSYDIEFAFSSANTYTSYNPKTGKFEKVQQQTGKTGNAKFYIDGVQFASMSVTQAQYYEDDDTKNVYNTFTVPAAKFTGTQHSIRIVIDDIANNTAEEVIAISIISATLTSSYISSPTSLADDIVIPVTVAASNSADIFYKVDDEADVMFTTVPTGNGLISVRISPLDSTGTRRTHDEHIIRLWATTYIPESDTTITTDIIVYHIIWYDVNSIVPIVATRVSNKEPGNNGEYTLEQYDYVTITYQVHPESTIDLISEDESGVETIINSLTVKPTSKNWTYTLEKEGKYILSIRAKYVDGIEEKTIYSTKYTVNVTKAAYSLDATPGAVMYFTAKNRSNDEENPAVWTSEIGDYTATLTGFSWNSNSGWNNQGNTTSLKVASGARCTIPFAPFDSDYRDTGQTIEFDFSTSNLSDSTTTVIASYSEADKSGIIINANNAYFVSNRFNLTEEADSRIYIPFKENERIRIAFVITPKSSDEEGHGPNDPEAIVKVWNTELQQYEDKNSINLGWWRFVKVYLNGICVSIQQYGESSFKQNTPSFINIGSDNATVDVYSIRAYKTVLYDKAIVDNYIADTQDPSEKLRLFKRNNILNLQGTDLDYSKLVTKIPCLFVTCESDSTYKGFTNNDHVLPIYKGDKRGFTILFNCEQLEDRSYYNFCTSFFAKNAQMNVQGTSSQYYPRKNWKMVFKCNKTYNPDYNAQIATKKPTYLYVGATGENIDLYKKDYPLRVYPDELADTDLLNLNSLKAKEFCLKADFAESSGCNNTGMAKYVDFCLKSQGAGWLTPPQLAEYNASTKVGPAKMTDVHIRTTVDGYPIAMFWRRTSADDYSFYGKYNFNFDKGAENVFGFIDSIEDVINPYTGQPFVQFDEDYYDNASDEDRISYEPPVECWEFTNNTTGLCKFKDVDENSFKTSTFSPDEGKNVADWTNSFENRHPDNDTLADDYFFNGKVPTHWEKFCMWVSSTDRIGYKDVATKLFPIPTRWEGTYDELLAGSGEQEVVGIYVGSLEELNADESVAIDKTMRYVLQPVTADGEQMNDYLLYGHIVHYDTATSTWVDDGPYVQEETDVDYSIAYHIDNAADVNYKNVYKYNTETKTWDKVGNLDTDYLLPAPVIYKNVEYKYDTAEYRLAKFIAELPKHMNMNMTIAYYILSEFFCSSDQRAKNMMFASWGYEEIADDSYVGEKKPVYRYNKVDKTTDELLFYVPKEAEYIWYPIFYDNDTILGINNTGYIKFDPNVESTDRVGTGYAFNGTESVLWLNLKDAFISEIADMYADMRTKALTYEYCQRYFTDTQSSQWAENVYNVDGKFKYVVPATKGYTDYSQTDNNGVLGVNIQEPGYLYEMQGPRAEHRKWWLSNRISYMDSRYNTGTYKTSYATLRLYTPTVYEGVPPNSTFTITPYSDMYLRIKFGSVDSYTRAEKNKPYNIVPPPMRFNDTETIIYGAPYILSFGQLADKYAGSVAIGNATKVTELLLGAESPYYNQNLTNLSVSSSNGTLKKIDVRGCSRLTVVDGIGEITALESFLGTGTAITELEFAKTGANLREIAYPVSITTIKLINMNYIQNSGLTIPSYTNINNLWIESCPNLESWNIINNILGTANNALKNVRITDINWSIATSTAFDRWSTLLKKSGISDTGSYNMDIPYLTGSVNIATTVSTGYKMNVEKMFRDVGCNLTVTTPNTTPVTGIKLIGDTDIAPNEWYTYKVSYLPDDFVLDSQRGVTWNIDNKFKYRNMTTESVEVMYEGSTSGTNFYQISASSNYNASYTSSLSVRPTATLSKIKVFDTNGIEIDYERGIQVDEGKSVTLNLGFVPTNTKDTDVTFELTGASYISYEYDPVSKSLTVTGKEVSKQQVAYITVVSAIIPTITASIKFYVNNVVSRIFYLQNAAGDKIPGYLDITYYDTATHATIETQEFSAEATPGVIALPTNSKYGFGELKVVPHATNENSMMYNAPATIIAPEIPSSTSSDVTYTATFYEPITATISVYNSGTLVNDRNLIIESAQNSAIRQLTTPPYNKVRVGTAANPATIQLLANTAHNITITEIDDAGNKVVSGGRYSQYTGIITTTTSNEEYSISISRDYLGSIDRYDDTELHMTVVTGSGNYVVGRVYVRTTGAIIINWGDMDEQSNNGHLTTIDTAIEKETPFYHIYKTPNKEYDIQVAENTARIRWFHVTKESATEMLPCIGRSSSEDAFNTAWGDVDDGGLVAYQSIGGAQFSTMPTFRFANKNFCNLLCVGNVYKSCVNCTSAESLLENTKVEQISDNPMFEKCIAIRSFKKTFKNSNITTIPANFFISNVNAVNFEETFSGCANLSSINSEEDVDFLVQSEFVEVESVKNMFYNCSTLSSEVPALWKTYYGCSFASAEAKPNAFAGCTKVSNFDKIPASWGGAVNTPEYVEHEYRALDYIWVGKTTATPGKFELTDIYPKGNWRYVLDFTSRENPYEIVPLFGAAKGASEDAIESVIDFSRGGNANGTNPNIYTGYLTYRINALPNDNWQIATDSYGTSAKVFDGVYGSDGNRAVLDICHTTENKVKIHGKYDAENFLTYNITGWNEASMWEANLPLILLDIYNTHTMDYSSGYNPPYRGKTTKFHELKIYDENNVLIRDIIPVFGKIENSMGAFLHDVVNDKIYPYTGAASDGMVYYRKYEPKV